MAWEENSHICLHMQLIAILSRIEVHYGNKQRFVEALRKNGASRIRGRVHSP